MTTNTTTNTFTRMTGEEVDADTPLVLDEKVEALLQFIRLARARASAKGDRR